MATEKKVIDASVIVKWFVNEDGTREALELRDMHISGKIKIVVPELVFLEVLNALRYKGHDEKALNEVNNNLWELQLHVEKINKFLLNKVASISLTHDLSFYDAFYVALAVLSGIQIITADKDLSKIPNVVMLK